MICRVLFVTFVILIFITSASLAIVINEIVAANDSLLFDADNDTPDWIELYNETDKTVDLTDYSLTDDPNEPTKWRFSEFTLDPQDYLVVLCSGKDRQNDEIHTNFRLDSDGEFIGLYSPDGEAVDTVHFPMLEDDMSFGRYPNGTGAFVFMKNPTPGKTNATCTELQPPKPDFSVHSRVSESNIQLELSTNVDDATIYYSIDATGPSAHSKPYDGPITIETRTVVRAQVTHPDMTPSEIALHMYFIQPKDGLFQLPVLSVVTDPENLWDQDRGIYTNPTFRGNEWERPFTLLYFNTDKQFTFSADAGIRIHGGASRERAEKKSFRLYFRSDYGPARLNASIIPSTNNTEFDRLVLRAGYNDSWVHRLHLERSAATFLRDQLLRDLFVLLGHPAAHGDFIHLFLNTQYWGLYNITERYDDEFFDSYLEQVPWHVVSPGSDENNNAIEAIDGDVEAWLEFENWFKRTDFSTPEAYEELTSRVYITNFVDFYLLNIWAQNSDWPRHNWVAARKPDTDAKWWFLPWDGEYAFGGGMDAFQEDINMINVIAEQVDKYAFANFLWRVQQNPTFLQAAMPRFDQLKSTLLLPERLEKMFQRRIDQIEPAIPFEAERWGRLFEPDYVYDKTSWQQAIDGLLSFVHNRTAHVEDHFDQLTSEVKNSSPVVHDYRLYPNVPNPFNNSTTISFSLAEDQEVDLIIYNINGQAVRHLVKGQKMAAGEHALKWQGKDDKTQHVGSGVYVTRLEAGSFSQTRKICIVK